MRYLLILFAALLLQSYSFATWSIIIVNPKTGEIGIAGASCTHNCSGIGKIVPGKGAIIVQAMSSNEARRKGIEMILNGILPETIIQTLRDPSFDPERQQYAVVMLNHLDTPATYTGLGTPVYGATLTDKGISVQGNSLPDDTVIEAAMAAAIKGRNDGLRIEEILMLALEAGSRAGGDKRCGEQRATCAFITMARPTDKLRKPYLFLEFYGQKKGGMNAVTLLRGKYERWKKHSA